MPRKNPPGKPPKEGKPVASQSCGCTSDAVGLRWVALCRTHRSEFEQLHEQAQRDYEQQRDKRKRA